MKILVVCQYYHPEPFRIHEVCEELALRKHQVTVLTGLPNYPMGVIPEEYKKGAHRDETVNSVRVIRVKERPRTPGKIGLALNYLSFVVSAGLKAVVMKKDFDVIFVYQLSPVLMAIPAYVAKWFSKTEHIAIYCLDLWPESLTSLGIDRNGFFFRFMKKVSVMIYKGADSIGYTSRMFRQYFISQLGVEKEHFIHIPQFADDLFSNISADTDGITGKEEGTVNYVFAGNIGMMQSVDTIIKAAAAVSDERIRWHIVGDGFALEDCKKLVSDMKLEDRVFFYGRLPVEKMPQFYAMADAMIVTLADNEMISYTLPGKIQSYMAAQKAVIAAANGETANVIKEADCGMCAPAEDEKMLARIADEMAASADFKRLGENSRKYYNTHFTKKDHVDLIEKMLMECAK
ncbi:MAG: glycosyltransferase family 4 protein [Lachnospiraceae bacterium]|nr:glycosyltransferase family 4 protein [Lachnospiraceae bacterium]